MIKVKNIIYILVAVLFTSCSDEFLDKDNPNALSTGTFWKSNEDLSFGLNGTYKAFSSPNNIRLVENLHRSDLAWGSGFRRPATSNPFYLQNFNNSAEAIRDQWDQNYLTIFRANQVIDAANKLLKSYETDPEFNIDNDADGVKVVETNSMLSQARFIRGYIYFLLHNNFNGGAVPIKDKLPVDEEDFFTPVSSSEKVREFYLKDLQYAFETLPSSWEDSDKGRVTSGAAAALIAQSHLYAGEFSEAAIMFEEVMKLGYELTEDIGSNFTTRDEFNKESILEVGYTLSLKNDLPQWDSRDVANQLYVKQFTGIQGWFGAGPASWLISRYKSEVRDSTDVRNYVDRDNDGVFDVDTNGKNILKSYSLRTSQSIALVDDLDLGYYGFDVPGQAALFNINFTSFWRKHTNWDLGLKNEDVVSPGKVRSGVNERLIRLAEVYLQYAECQIELGNLDIALEFINKVRTRSGLQLLGTVGISPKYDGVVYDGATLMNWLRYTEYPLELSAEGDGNRNVDLRRWGKFGAYPRLNNKLERFKELSAKRYISEHYEVLMPVDPENPLRREIVTRWESSITEANDPSDPLVNEKFNDSEQAAKNYIEAEHDYLPIPIAEELSNPKLYN